MAKCKPRFAEVELKRPLKTFDAVLIEGPRFCGKAAVAERFVKYTSHPLNDKQDTGF